jgi:LPXTG-motif cell wall-anchored protein
MALALTFGGVSVAAAQQTTTSKEIRNFTVISVNGNKVVARDATGTREYTVPDDFKFDVGGKQIGVSELKPGMRGTATVTTTTTTTPVTVTEVREGTVMQATGNSLIVRTPTGIRMFSVGDIQKRNATLMKDGKPIDFTNLHQGDKLTATIVTDKPPQVMTARQVQASIAEASGTAGAAAPAPARAAAAPTPAPAAAPAAAAPAAPAPAKKLPKTGSSLPLLGMTGVALLALAAGLTMLRRRAEM